MKILYAHTNPLGTNGSLIRPSIVPQLRKMVKNYYSPKKIEEIYGITANTAFESLVYADLAFIFEENSPIWRQDFLFFTREANRERVPIIGVKKRKNFPMKNQGLVEIILTSDIINDNNKINKILRNLKIKS